MPIIREVLERAVKFHQAGNLPQAEQLYRQVLTLDPNQPDALHLLGVMASQTDKPEIAIDLIGRAVAVKPDEPEFRRNLAAAYKAAGDTAAAAAQYRELLRLMPNSLHAHVYLSDALMEQGQLDDALAHSLEAKRLDPDSALAFCTLGELAVHGCYTFTDADIAKMQSLVAEARQHPRDLSLLWFTLAAHWEKKGDYEEAFRCYCRANELKRDVYREAKRLFDPQRHIELIDGLIATFTPELFERMRPFGSPSEQPIFVVGMVRSGTSLVEQILASLPGVAGVGELRDIDQISLALPLRLGTPLLYPACMKIATEEIGRQMANLYLGRLNRLGGGAARVVDKMPHNFLHLGLISVLFPHSRIIHCRRDMMDVCVATYCQNFKWLTYAASQEEIGFYYRHYERLMDHWRRVLPLPMHDVVYEEMVANQEAVSRALVDFCGLPWDDRCLAFHKNQRTVQTSSKLQVRQPIYTRSVARWKRYEAHLQPLRDALANPEIVGKRKQ